jgi:dTMP kinase
MQLIAIEGIDGAGKRTQVRRLVDTLRADNLQVLDVSFPRYGTFWGKLVREYLHGRLGDFPPLAAALLFAADRGEFGGMLRDAAGHYDVVVADRYTYSNVAHQAARVMVQANGNPGAAPQLEAAAAELRDQIVAIEFDQYGLPRPDLTIWLDADPEITAGALLARGEALDQHESDLAYQRAVRQEYALLAESWHSSKWARIPVTDSNGWRDADKIARGVYEVSRSLLVRELPR